MSAEDFAALPAQLPVRLIRTVITAPGSRTREVTLATTLVDPEAYPADTLREIYARRWNIELPPLCPDQDHVGSLALQNAGHDREGTPHPPHLLQPSCAA